MKKNILGNTGIEVSPICFGTLTIGPNQKNLSVAKGGDIIKYAIEKGINFFDTAQLYQTYKYLKYAMDITKKYDIVISSKTYAYNKQGAIDAVEQARKELNRDYIDIFLLHEQESIHTLNGHKEALDTLFYYKQKGIIKAVGLSTHNIQGVNGGIKKELDVIHPLININGLGIGDGPLDLMEEAIKNAFNYGIGIFSMKALGGGNLHKNAKECLNYIFDNKFIHSVAIGMQSINEINSNINFYNNRNFSKQDIEYLNNKKRSLHIDNWCVGCGKCIEKCKQNALYLENGKIKCKYEKCILCSYCSYACPEWAIKVV